ncbi:hypothetical protein GCM10028808_23910 [Spirosoma migulaei]
MAIKSPFNSRQWKPKYVSKNAFVCTTSDTAMFTCLSDIVRIVFVLDKLFVANIVLFVDYIVIRYDYICFAYF